MATRLGDLELSDIDHPPSILCSGCKLKNEMFSIGLKLSTHLKASK